MAIDPNAVEYRAPLPGGCNECGTLDPRGVVFRWSPVSLCYFCSACHPCDGEVYTVPEEKPAPDSDCSTSTKTEWRLKSRGMWVAGVSINSEGEESRVEYVGLVANEQHAQTFEEFDDANNLAKFIGADIFATTITTSTKQIPWPEKGATDG